MKKGYVSQVIGPVVDVHFTDEEQAIQLPAIHEALSIKREGATDLIVEVQQHIGEHTGRGARLTDLDAHWRPD